LKAVSETQEPLVAALSRAHANLLTDLRGLKQTLQGRVTDIIDLRRRLSKIREHLEDHFRFEEQNGYLDMIRNRELRLSHSIQHLAEQHQLLLETLDALIAAAEAATSVDRGLADEIMKWINDVREHEARENELVQDAFNFDIAAED
jgi:hypothetical protein